MFHSYYIIVIIIFIITTIIWKTNNQMKADVKLNKLAKLQLHMLNVRQTTALTVRHYANVILWLKFLPMGLKGLMVNLNTVPIHVKCVKITILFWYPWDCMVGLFKKFKFSLELFILK